MHNVTSSAYFSCSYLQVLAIYMYSRYTYIYRPGYCGQDGKDKETLFVLSVDPSGQPCSCRGYACKSRRSTCTCTYVPRPKDFGCCREISASRPVEWGEGYYVHVIYPPFDSPVVIINQHLTIHLYKILEDQSRCSLVLWGHLIPPDSRFKVQ